MTLLSQLRKDTPSASDQALARHEAFIAQFLERLDSGSDSGAGSRHVTLLARSPHSPVAGALLSQAEGLRARDMVLRLIFAQLGEGSAVADFAEFLTEVTGAADARDHIRWARNKSLWDAHEQITLGRAMCWSGDCMRREPGKRNSLDLFEADAPQTVRLGLLAFDAIWAIADPLPLSAASRDCGVKPSAAYAPAHEESLSALSFLNKGEGRGTLAH